MNDVDDYLILSNDGQSTYIFLCGIKFNKETLDNLNINKKISKTAKAVEDEFFQKYSDKFNLVINE